MTTATRRLQAQRLLGLRRVARYAGPRPDCQAAMDAGEAWDGEHKVLMAGPIRWHPSLIVKGEWVAERDVEAKQAGV